MARAREVARGVFYWWRRTLARVSGYGRSRSLPKLARSTRERLHTSQDRVVACTTRAFAWWRATLAAALRWLRSAAPWASLGRAATLTLRSWIRPQTTASIGEREAPLVIAASVVAPLGASIASSLLGLRGEEALWAYIAGLVVWSVARLAVLLMLAAAAAVAADRVVLAWAVALPPLALSAFPGFGLAGFALSAVAAYFALSSVGASKSDALRLVAWAYGGHALGAAASTLASTLLAR